MYDVIIVGAGPTGTMLAAELRLRGIEVLVLEGELTPPPHVRALGLHVRSLEILDQRGLLETFLADGVKYPSAARFAGIDREWPADLDTAHGYVLGLPQPITDRILEDHAAAQGAHIRRGIRVVGLEELGESVILTSATGETFRGRWVVGCDGGHSFVRRALGIAFPGEAAQNEWLLGEVELDATPEEVAVVSARVRVTHRGFGIGPTSEGWYRAVVPAASVAEDRSVQPDIEEFRQQLRIFAGTDFGARSPRWLSRFTDATRLAERYHRDRVLIAGDAAHVHPPLGGQGLNLGIQDAFNLGWKLAATIRGSAPVGLLETYESERRPVADDMLAFTRAQSVLIAGDAGGQAVRRLVAELMAFDNVNRLVVERMIGTGIDYGRPAHAHAWVGTRLSDRAVGEHRLYEALRRGRGLLLTRTEILTTDSWADRVDRVVELALPLPEDGMLIRPDGYIAWVGSEQASLVGALTHWFGATRKE